MFDKQNQISTKRRDSWTQAGLLYQESKKEPNIGEKIASLLFCPINLFLLATMLQELSPNDKKVICRNFIIGIVAGLLFSGAGSPQAFFIAIYTSSLLNEVYRLQLFNKKQEIERKFLNIGLCSRGGNTPEVISNDPVEGRMVLDSPGIPTKTYRSLEHEINSMFQINVKKVEVGDNQSQIVIKYIDCLLPKFIPFADETVTECMSQPHGSVLIGFDGLKHIFMSFSTAVQFMIAGVTGGGKTRGLYVLITSAILSSFKHGIQTYMIDMKMVEAQKFSDYVETFPIVEQDTATLLIEYIHEQLEQRMRLFAQHQVVSYDEYLRIGSLPIIFFVFDEITDYTLSLKSKQHSYRKSSTPDPMKLLTDIICKGRSFGIHVVVSSQFPDSKALPAIIRQNTITKLIFKMNSDATSIALMGNSEAYNIESVPGRFVLSTGGDDYERLQMPFIDNPIDILKRYVPVKPVNTEFTKFLLSKGRSDLLTQVIDENKRRGF